MCLVNTAWAMAAAAERTECHDDVMEGVARAILPMMEILTEGDRRALRWSYEQQERHTPAQEEPRWSMGDHRDPNFWIACVRNPDLEKGKEKKCPPHRGLYLPVTPAHSGRSTVHTYRITHRPSHPAQPRP